MEELSCDEFSQQAMFMLCLFQRRNYGVEGEKGKRERENVWPGPPTEILEAGAELILLPPPPPPPTLTLRILISHSGFSHCRPLP